MAAVELALCMPVILGVCGVIIVTVMAISARHQMLEVTYRAVTTCASEVGSSIDSVRACVRGQAQMGMTNNLCTPTAAEPEMIALVNLQPPSAGTRIWAVTQRMSCTFRLGLPFLFLLPGGAPQPFTVAATSTAPFIPSS